MDTMTAVTAEAFKLAREGTDVMVDFGRLDGVPVPSGLVSIDVTDQVILPLETARRLLVWLDDSIAPHMAKMRADQAKALNPGDAAVAARPDQTCSVRSRTYPAKKPPSCCVWSAPGVCRINMSGRFVSPRARCRPTASC